MVSFSENELLPISALQHLHFCPRQCALIHVEQTWAENRFTAEGRILHERPDKAGATRHLYACTRCTRSIQFGNAGVVLWIRTGSSPLNIFPKKR
jgi:CRISPR-associated exonuclease Cas4